MTKSAKRRAHDARKIRAISEAARPCYCENNACTHPAGRCKRAVDPSMRLMYIGAVCPECYLKCAPQWRLPKRAPFGYVQEIAGSPGALAGDAIVFRTQAEAQQNALRTWGHTDGINIRPATEAEAKDYARRWADDRRILGAHGRVK